MKASIVSSIVLSLLLFSATTLASDHADPMNLKFSEPEANITGLFFFPEVDNMVVVFNIRRSLTATPPYNLEPFEYTVNMDQHSQLSFENAQDRARYGGTIVNPEGISPDISIKIQLNNDASLKTKTFVGLKNTDSIQVYTGVRDDPFIFPRFFKVNVISMIFKIPMSSFPSQKTWLLWGTSARVSNGEQIDHVGRSNRTQLGRFDILNTLPPSQHVREIKEKAESREKIQNFLKDCFTPLANLNQLSGFLIRHYDYVPDVMIYNSELPAGFPNGRRLTDDVALLTCQQGDCPLQENAFIDTKEWPRAIVNDKPFTAEFPYLAEPWPLKDTPPPSDPCMSHLGMFLMAVVAFIMMVVMVIYRFRKRIKTTQ